MQQSCSDSKIYGTLNNKTVPKTFLTEEKEGGTQVEPALKMNATTQTTFASEANICNMKEVAMQALGAQKQIISKGCDDAVLCSPRFLILLFNKREKWIQFMLEVDLNLKRSGTEVIVDLPNESEPTTFCKMEIEKDMEFKEEPINMNWKEDPPSHSIKTQDNLIFKRDQEDEISLGVEELLTPSNKVNVGDMRDQGDKITYMELLDPSTEMGVDVTLHNNSLQHEFSKRRKIELDSPSDFVWNLKDSHLFNEEKENENHSQSPKSSESNLEGVLIEINQDIEIMDKSTHLNWKENIPMSKERNLKRASDFTTKDELRRTFIKNKYPILKECFVSVKRLSRQLTATDIPKSVAVNVMNNKEDREIKDKPIDLNLTYDPHKSSEPNSERIKFEEIYLKEEKVDSECDEGQYVYNQPTLEGEFEIQEETKEHMETLPRRTVQGLESQCSIRPNDARPNSERIRLTASYSRPYRPCIYCGKYQSALTNHLKVVHSNETDVKNALSMPKYEKNAALRLIKKKGIHMINLDLLKERVDYNGLVRERNQGTGEVRLCTKCNGIYLKNTIKKHMKSCIEIKFNENSVDVEKDMIVPASVNLNLLVNDYSIEENDNELFKEMMTAFRNDAIGQFCLINKEIKAFGLFLLNKKCKTDVKAKPSKQCVRNEMRTLAELFMAFSEKLAKKTELEINLKDMFQRKFDGIQTLPILREVIVDKAEKKSSKRTLIQTVMQHAITFFEGNGAINGEDDFTKEIGLFKFAFDFVGGNLFRAAQTFSLEKSDNIRLPEHMPKDDDVTKVRCYLVEKLRTLEEAVAPDFGELRSVLVTRLIFLNGRRGGEACRLLKTDWERANKNIGLWLNKDILQKIKSETARQILSKFKLVYVTGKGIKEVPLLIPQDCWRCLDIIKDAEYRDIFNIPTKNPYMFAVLCRGLYYVTGNSDINNIISKVDIESHITATGMRHYVSKQVANLDLPEDDLAYVYKHFGHSRDINKNVYQSSLAIQEITLVGGALDIIDKKLCSTSEKECFIEDGVNLNEETLIASVQEFNSDNRDMTLSCKRKRELWSKSET